MFTINSFIAGLRYSSKQLLKRVNTKNKHVTKITYSWETELCSKSKSRDKVAKEYGFSVKTLNRRFKAHNLNIPQGLICPDDLRRIYLTLGLPGNIKTKVK